MAKAIVHGNEINQRIADLERSLETVEELAAARIREISAVLRIARAALPGATLPGGPAGDVAVGIGAALSMLTVLDGAVYGVISEVHQCCLS